jgi:hypothetical protein
MRGCWQSCQPCAPCPHAHTTNKCNTAIHKTYEQKCGREEREQISLSQCEQHCTRIKALNSATVHWQMQPNAMQQAVHALPHASDKPNVLDHDAPHGQQPWSHTRSSKVCNTTQPACSEMQPAHCWSTLTCSAPWPRGRCGDCPAKPGSHMHDRIGCLTTHAPGTSGGLMPHLPPWLRGSVTARPEYWTNCQHQVSSTQH